MTELIGKPCSEEIVKGCSDFILENNSFMPVLAIIRIGERPDDISYEKGIQKKFLKAGIEVKTYTLPEDTDDKEFQESFDFINNDPEIDAIILMRPLPENINEKEVIRKLKPWKDVDGITDSNIAGVMRGDRDSFAPCTSEAVVRLLKYYHVPLEGKKAVIIGRSMVVGKPLSMLLLKENMSVTVLHSKSEDIKAYAKEAQVLAVSVGKAKFVDSSFIGHGQYIVDVGINSLDGKLCGDCDFENIKDLCEGISPVPGGLGQVTTGVLLEHVVRAYCLNHGLNFS